MGSHYVCKDCNFVENTKIAVTFNSNRWIADADEVSFPTTRCPQCNSENVYLISEYYVRTEEKANRDLPRNLEI